MRTNKNNKNKEVLTNKEESMKTETNKTNLKDQMARAKKLFEEAKAAVLANNEVYSLIETLYEDTKSILGKEKELFRYSSFDYATSHIMGMINASICNPDKQKEILSLLKIGKEELMVFKRTRPYWFVNELKEEVSSTGDAEGTFALMYHILTKLGINLDKYKLLISEERMEQMFHYIKTGEKLPLVSDTLIQ